MSSAERVLDPSATAGELLVAAPMRIEAALISSAGLALGAALSGTRAAAARRSQPLVRKTGMGPGRSKAAAAELAGAAGRAMLVLGFCGGLDASSVPGEVIVAEEVYAAADEGHPDERVRCELSAQLIQRLTGLGLKVRAGNVVCVSRLALGERRAELHAGGAIAVDMESVWLAAGALRAARALRRVAAALNEWAPAP